MTGPKRTEPEDRTLWAEFCRPRSECRSIPKWIWNTPLENIDAGSIREQLAQFRDHDGYGGVMIVLWGHEGYMTEEYFRKYGEALDIAAELGLGVVIWDENGFPTGRAGGVFEQKYPDLVARRLDMHEIGASGPCELRCPAPAGKLMAAVAVREGSGERVDLTGCVAGGMLAASLPQGSWRVMCFTAVKEESYELLGVAGRFIDYLSADAVGKFIALTHQRYYDRFPRHFGTTIRYAFYDEPSFWRMQGRIWTEGFNEMFEAKYGYSPVPYYPALWADIGPDTEAARNALLGFRAELYAENFVGQLADWCGAHGIGLTGHMDQEEVVNPAMLTGDLMKVLGRQHMPGVDEIFQYGRGSRGYKVVSSAACNYDNPAVMCEAYGAMGEDMPASVLYREAMDLYAKGVSFMVPHGTWYDNVNGVIFPPELSYRSRKFGPELPAYNQYVAGLTAMLRGGSHVADIAVLYPIASLQAGTVFGRGDAYQGGTIAEGTNYMDVGEALSLSLRRDFTYLHPEVLDARCSVRGADLCLDNEVNRERYGALVLPGSRVIHASNARKIRQFYEQGGKVIAVGRIPGKSAELGLDGDVVSAMEAVFGADASAAPGAGGIVRENRAGGRAYAVPAVGSLRAALEDALPVPDVGFEDDIAARGGNFTYIHKIKDGAHIFFFANSGDAPVDTYAILRGSLAPETWDPHRVTKSIPEYGHRKLGGFDVTRVRIHIPPVQSIFIVAFIHEMG